MSRFLVVLAVAAVAAAAYGGFVTEPSGHSFGAGVLNYRSGQIAWNAGTPRSTVVYDDTTTVTAGFSQNPSAIIGDDLTLTQGGTLDSVMFSVYNSSTASGALMSSTNVINFYDGQTSQLIGGFSVDLTYGNSGLPQGYYTTITVTDLGSLNIALPTAILATQQINSVVGSNKVGQVLADPPAIGSSTDAFYLDNTVAVPPGTDVGFFNFGGSPVANLYWQVSIPEPAAFSLLALGGLLVRRR